MQENNEQRELNQELSQNNLTRPEKRNSSTYKRIPWYVFALIGAGICVIFFAFANEARANREANLPASDHPLTRYEAQAEINRLSWVEQDFLTINDFSRPGTRLEEINGIVIHNIGNPNTTAAQNRSYFENLATTQETKASSNFIICMDGTILQCIPVYEIAFASNQRNDDTISIEICHPDETGKFTQESYDAAVRLTAWLCAKFWLTSEDVIRHFDVQGKECPRYFVDNPDAWAEFKADVQRVIDQE